MRARLAPQLIAGVMRPGKVGDATLEPGHPMTGLLLSILVLAAGRPALEIHGSLSGYNLIPPASRCCAFDLDLDERGKLTVTLRSEDPPHLTATLIPLDQLEAIRRIVQSADYFSLPEHVGAMLVDGDEHRMRIRLGQQTRDVTLYSWGNDRTLSKQERDQVRRTLMVWDAIRLLVRDPKATVR